jgi:hypothetical protein
MNKCKKYLEALTDGSYFKMPDNAQKAFKEIMDKDCQETFNKMQATLHIMDQQAVPDPGEEYWQNYWNKLERRLENNKPDNNFSWATLMRIAAILLCGIFIGYLIFSPGGVIDDKIVTNDLDIKRASLNKRTAEVLEDSKVLLLGIVNMDSPGINDSEKIDFSFQKKISGNLLLQTADLKQQLSKTKNRRIVSLINELEMILMQISNLEDNFDLPAIEMIKQGAENQSLLFKIDMERLLMEAKDEQNSAKQNNSKNES